MIESAVNVFVNDDLETMDLTVEWYMEDDMESMGGVWKYGGVVVESIAPEIELSEKWMDNLIETLEELC